MSKPEPRIESQPSSDTQGGLVNYRLRCSECSVFRGYARSVAGAEALWRTHLRVRHPEAS